MWLGLLALAHAACGDGVVDAGEQCDDFNVVGLDGCSELCEAEPMWECTSPPEPFLESVRWSGRTNCATTPVVDLDGIGVRVDLPEWSAFGISPTGLDCVSAWSSGDAGRWFWSTTWQLGAHANGNGGSMASGRYSLAACKAASESAVSVIRPEGERTLHIGMRDNPCTDNRGSVQVEVGAISDCTYTGEVDDCPSVYLQLPEPYAANRACVSELASWSDATVGPWSNVHRDAQIDGVQIGRRAAIHRSAVIGSDSVVMRLAEVGQSAVLGPGTVLGAGVSVGEFVSGQSGERLLMMFRSRLGAGTSVGDDVSVGPRTVVGTEVSLMDGVVLARAALVGAGSALGDNVVVGPEGHIGEGAVVGERSRLRRGAVIADGAVLGSDCVIGRDAIIGAGAVLGDGVLVRRGAVVPAGASIEAGTVIVP